MKCLVIVLQSQMASRRQPFSNANACFSQDCISRELPVTNVNVLHCKFIQPHSGNSLTSSSGIMECACMLFTFENEVLLMR